MKASENIVKALADIERIEKGSDARRVCSEMMLALARKEISATDVEAMAKIVTAQAVDRQGDLRMAMWAHRIRTEAAQLYAAREYEDPTIAERIGHSMKE